MFFIAFYDMDKTVTRFPTWTRFLIHAARRRAPWRLALLPVAAMAGLGYLLGLTDRAGLKQFTQRLMLGSATSPADIAALAESFADTVVSSHIIAAAHARMAADHAEGYRLVLATASHAYYAAEIGRRLGFSDVIGTRAQAREDGHLVPLIEGENCYGPVKLRMVQEWMAAQGIARKDAHIRAYSDHVSDAPLLEWADEAFAVNAHAPLRALAVENGWGLPDWG